MDLINVPDFLAKTNGEFDRPNRFLVIVTPAEALGIASDVQELMTSCIYSATLPPSTLGVVGNLWVTGRQVKVKGDRTFGDITTTVYADAPLAIWKSFNTWSNKMDSNERIVTDSSINTPEDYMATLTFVKFDDKGNTTAEMEYGHCFPTVVGALPSDWSQTDSVSTFEVTWTVNYLSDEGITL